jgi:hypothetical protein
LSINNGTRMTRIKLINTDFLFSMLKIELKSVQNPLNPYYPWLIDSLGNRKVAFVFLKAFALPLKLIFCY